MTMSRISDFLEDFDAASSPVSGELPFPGFLSLGESPLIKHQQAADERALSEEEAIASARDAAYREGYAAASAELEARHREQMSDLERQFEQRTEEGRLAMEAQLAAGISQLFGQYDDWLDRLVDAELTPFLKRAMTASAIDQMKQSILETVGRNGMELSVEGPAKLVEVMRRLLEPQGIEVKARVNEDSELAVQFGETRMRTRLSQLAHLGCGQVETAKTEAEGEI